MKFSIVSFLLSLVAYKQSGSNFSTSLEFVYMFLLRFSFSIVGLAVFVSGNIQAIILL